jgi:DNA-binding IclR family transcriptional regulator
MAMVADHLNDEVAASTRSVLGRIAIVLDSFDEVHVELSLSEITERAMLPKSTVHRIAEQLVALGWLERCSRGYQVGMRLFELGGLARRRSRLRDKAMPFMQELSSLTHCAIHLGILDRYEVVYLATIPARGLTLPTREGGRMPAQSTGLGKAMLAFSDQTVVDAILNQPTDDCGFAPLAPPALREELLQIRAMGVAFDREEARRGVACAAAPIRGAGRPIAAISITGHAEDFNFERSSKLARRAAEGVWSELFQRRAN